ncbi:MAG: amidase [Dehalococcoidia bacterium]
MAQSTRPWELTAAEAAALIASGQLSPVELVASCIERIDQVEPHVQAWALVDRTRAMEAARQCEEEIAQGKRKGPLHGIPIGVKDIFYTAGLATEAGSRVMAGFVPDHDATSVARLREAGAIVLGKTQTTEFALFDPAPTRNPWGLEHTPGGSSSGSGAAVAAGMCPLALGSQTAGSVLRPAAYNGVVGLKGRHGRVSAYGVVPLAWTLDHVGVLARTVEDAAVVLQAIAGYDPQDPYSLDEPAPDYAAALQDPPGPPRLGLVREHFFEKTDLEMQRHTDDVVRRLREAGAAVEEVSLPPSFATIAETLRPIITTECAAFHQESFAKHKDLYGPRIRSIIERGLAVTGAQYAQAIQQRHRQRLEMTPVAEAFDALVTPGATGDAPGDLTTTGDPAMQTPWSVLGFPSISLPSGLSQAGLPLAVQLAAAPRGEERLLQAARWCQGVLDFGLRPPIGA